MIIKEYNKFVNKKIDKNYLLSGIKEFKNFKPSKFFDSKYGTTLSQDYTFPFDLTADEVYGIIRYDIDYYKKHNVESEKYEILIDNLTNEYFPYVNFDDIDKRQKECILSGMASCFNSDDIIWFSVYEMFAYKNIEVNSETDKFPKVIEKDIQWVMSPSTLSNMKKQLKKNEFL